MSSHNMQRQFSTLLNTQLHSARRPVASTPLRAFSPSPSTSRLPSRGYATEPDTQAKRMAELQAKQMKLAEKAGRMKQNIGVIANIPVFANHIPPKTGRQFPEGTPLRTKWDYFKTDKMNAAHSLYTRYLWRRILGPKWYEKFEERALIAYKTTNIALTTGNYEKLQSMANSAVVDAIKSERSRKLRGLRLSWKLHKVISREVVCARQQEIKKANEHVAQMAVRFITEQSLEIQDVNGRKVGTGSHSSPETVTEYYVFQRDMWRPEDDWMVVKRGAKETDLIANPEDQP